MKIEKIKINGYSVSRFHLKTGFIDRFMSSNSLSPEEKGKGGMSTSMSLELLKLNGKGEWRSVLERGRTLEYIDLFGDEIDTEHLFNEITYSEKE